MAAEVERCVREFDVKGIKLHPAEGHYFPADDRLWAVYEIAQEFGLVVLSHGGVHMASPDVTYTQPSNFAPVFERFPDLELVIAHLGHGFWDEAVELAKKYPRALFDTSAVISGVEHLKVLSNDAFADLIRKLGVDRVMFGSDYPWFSPAASLRHILQLPLKPDEREKILGENARHILGI